MADRGRIDISQAIKYLGVGGGTALLELVLFRLLRAAQLSIPVSNVSAVVVATAANFLLNRSVTFKSASNPVRSAVLYMLLFAFNTAFSTGVITFGSSIGAPELLFKLLAMCCTVSWNYVLYRKVVFR